MPEFREYERTATTATNAVLTPLVGAYVAEFARRAQARCGAGTRVLVMRSTGGGVDAAESASAPLRKALSGPAGGVLGVARLALAAGFNRAFTFDMGGTSTDVAAVDDGEPTLTTEATIDCYPLRAPTIDLVSIGAGGGSLVAIGAGRHLTVGPLSAGAVPGPACYARGGTAATVTDCNLLLGRLPDSLLGGAMALDRSAAERALQPGAATLGLDTREFAASALELVTHNMAGAVRQVAVRRGLDSREYVLVAFGGAGPPHAARLAQLVGIRTVLVPPHPGLGSCNGLLIADILLDGVQTCVLRGAALTARAVAPVLDGLAAQLRRRAADASQASVRFRADLRYVGMGSEVRVAFADSDRADAALTPLLERFHAEHLRLFGYDYRGRHAVELLALRAELLLPR